MSNPVVFDLPLLSDEDLHHASLRNGHLLFPAHPSLYNQDDSLCLFFQVLLKYFAPHFAYLHLCEIQSLVLSELPKSDNPYCKDKRQYRKKLQKGSNQCFSAQINARWVFAA